MDFKKQGWAGVSGGVTSPKYTHLFFSNPPNFRYFKFMKYTLGFYIDHTKKGLKGLYLVSNDMEQEFFANPGESTRDFLERVGVDLKDVEPTREVMHNIYR